MNAIANVATNVERVSCFAGSINYAFASRSTSRAPRRTSALRINRQTIYAVREVVVLVHSSAHRDARHVIFA